MKIFKSIKAYRAWRNEQMGKMLGFVPTMGALHEGHLQLIRRSTEECEMSVVSIFVNPTQFNDAKDWETYPTPVEKDLQMCQDAGVDAVFMPIKADLYPDDYRYKMTETQESLVLEGQHRPGHFDGVLTVVLKLFNIIQPARAYFGEKDWQQLQLVKGMVESLFLPIEVIAHATVRERDGLAMSSRNVRLSADGRKLAPEFHQILASAETPEQAREALEARGFVVEYVEEMNGRRLGAVRLDEVRLIDNVSVPVLEKVN